MVIFVKFDFDFLKKSYCWLNDNEISYLTNTANFSYDNQIEWFQTLKQKKNYLIFGICYNSIPIGACGLKNITDNQAEYWGYIGEKSYWGKGIGNQIIDFLVTKAKLLKLEFIYLKVITSNIRAIKLYEKNSFFVTSIDDSFVYMKRFI